MHRKRLEVTGIRSRNASLTVLSALLSLFASLPLTTHARGVTAPHGNPESSVARLQGGKSDTGHGRLRSKEDGGNTAVVSVVSNHVSPPQVPPVVLTSRGQSIRRVLVVSLVGGGCRGDDWRGDLPRYIMSYLPEARAVLLNAKNETHWVCGECSSTHGLPGRQGHHHNNCQQYTGQDGKTLPADLMIVIGTGVYAPCESTKYIETCRQHKKYGDVSLMYPELRGIFSSGYVDSNTLAVHFPIRKLRSLRKLPFSVVVDDSDFVKPLANGTRNKMKRLCAKEPKTNDLLYVGRYQSSKGQLTFLQTVDPSELQGYHVHFYGSNMNAATGYHVKMRETARMRNISMTIHPPVDKGTLLRRYCRAVGQIHYASGDNNPRAAYEGLYAGNPLFISFESMVNAELYTADFVVGVKYRSDEFRKSFKHFMRLVRNQSLLQGRIESFVDLHLSPTQIYRRLCIQMGVCSSEVAGTGPGRNGYNGLHASAGIPFRG